jgi:hypothetical protein
MRRRKTEAAKMAAFGLAFHGAGEAAGAATRGLVNTAGNAALRAAQA